MALAAEQEYVRHFRAPNGSVGEIRESAQQVTPLPGGAVEITAEEYEQNLAALQADKAEYVAELEAAEAGRAKNDFDALTAPGLPEASARRLSGYIPTERTGEEVTR
ncbi:hypothetical protein [Streptosporangium sp. NPDC002607]